MEMFDLVKHTLLTLIVLMVIPFSAGQIIGNTLLVYYPERLHFWIFLAAVLGGTIGYLGNRFILQPHAKYIASKRQ